MLNLTPYEIEGLKAVDEQKFNDAVNEALDAETTSSIRDFEIHRCGHHLTQKLHYFEQALSNLRAAKSADNRKRKRYEADRAARELTYGLSGMKRRMEQEEKDAELFKIDDHVWQPSTFSRKLEISIWYQWRPTTQDDWRSGKIDFHHEVQPRIDLTLSAPKRKPSAAKKAEELQEELGRHWEDLRRQSLWSLRDFFRDGGNGAEVPSSFNVIASRDGYLNNFSTQWWKNTK